MRPPLLCLLVLASATLQALAENPPASPEPAATNRPPPIVSPEISNDYHVAFRLKAPQAQKVDLHGQWAKDPLPLTKGDDGVWALTTGPIPAGVWEYSLAVDGLSMIDPANPATKPQRSPTTSILHINGTPPNPWDFQDVPHGTVHQHTYASKFTGGPRECWVYTPPGYEAESGRQYPLLVLQHGSGDNQKTWVVHGKSHWILDNLIAQGKARPMVVMMIDGHPLGLVPRESTPDRKAAAMEAFRRELLDEAMPLVEGLYRVKKSPFDRAIAGLSMGGGQSLSVGLSNLDRFGTIGAFSAGPPSDDLVAAALADADGTNRKLRLLWIACGKDDTRVRPLDEEFVGRLTKAGIRLEWLLVPGGHTWPVWRNNLVDFLPKLFPDSK